MMRRRFWKHMNAALLTILAAFAMAQDIDLVVGTLDGEAICAMELDSVLDVLGRPSAVKSATTLLTLSFGPELFWHSKGLSALFEPGEAGKELVRLITIRVSREWDADRGEWYEPFSGSLAPAATANWRTTDSLTALAQNGATEVTPEDRRRMMLEAGAREDLLPATIPHSVEVNLSDSESLILQHEPITRYLEKVVYRCFTG